MTSSNATPHNALIVHKLAEELGELERFLVLLTAEQEALKEGAADKLPPLVEQKSALATRLGQLLSERERALVGAGFGEGRAGMEAWLSAGARTNDQSLHEQWQRLLDLVGKARSQQELNGKLIAVQLQHNQQALATLMSAAGRPLTYGPDGQQRLGGGGRTLGSA